MPGSALDPAASELATVARVLAEVCGLSLSGGMGAALRDAVVAAAAERGEAPLALARRVAAREWDAVELLVEHAVVPETAFWRHPEQLIALARRAAPRPGPLSIWCAGCATGEEPYGVAMALLEVGRAGRGDAVLGSDVSARALAAAARAAYGARALRKLPGALAERWLEPPDAAGLRRVREPARSLVRLERHNLVAAAPPSAAPFDVVLCRNVLIYFEAAVAAAVLHRLAAALAPGGALVLGPVELPLAAALPLDFVEEGGTTLLVRPG